MAATSLKLPDELKRRIEQAAAAAHKTPHAFMIDALTCETERREQQAQFAAAAERAEQEALASGRAVPLDAAFDYLGARVSGRRARKPRLTAWRKSR
jgi:predicted transcriptional regulator